MLRCLTISLIATFAVGCSSGDRDDESPTEQEGVFDPMVNTMDKARGVEDLSQSRKKELDEALEE